MIVRKQPTFRDILFALRGSILPHIAPRMLAVAVISIVAVVAADEWPGIFSRISAIPFTLIGIALSVFMSFRSNACYARWWEGRVLWGEVIIAARSLAREIAILPESDTNSQQLVTLFETEKVFYELAYELNNRPDWSWIPMRGISKLFVARN